MATHYTLIVESMGPSHGWAAELEATLPATIRAANLAEAQETCDRLLDIFVDRVMAAYKGPRGTEPTGLDALSISPSLAKRETAAEFLDLVARREWGEAADMVLAHLRGKPYNGGRSQDDGSGYPLADWMEEGHWTGKETPWGIAREWRDLY